jgi:hypothetical protein
MKILKETDRHVNTLRIDDGYSLEICTNASDITDIISKPLNECSHEFLEKAYDAVKLFAKKTLNPVAGCPSTDLIYIENMRPLCQLFFWAVKSLQKEGEIAKNIKIITLGSYSYNCNYPSESKFNLENQKKITVMSDVVEINENTFDIKTPGIYNFTELSNVFGSEIRITNFIRYDEGKNAFEVLP